MKATWNGFLTLGDIAMPVRLYTAVRSTAPRYVQIHAPDHSPVERLYKCQDEGREISPDEVARAVPVERGFIEVTHQDIRRRRGDAKSITIKQFSDPNDIDPSYYEKLYYMVPGKGGESAYALLGQALRRAAKAAVVTFTLHEKEHLGVMTVFDSMLRLQQLRFADEIISPAHVKLPVLPQSSAEQVNLTMKLLERYSAPFFIEDYHNEQNSIVHEIIDRKAKGLELRRETPNLPQITDEADVIPALKALLSRKSSKYLS